jgi:hypothetical protein
MKATYWILTFGRDCDGYAKDRVIAFPTDSSAYDTAFNLSEWSDGLQYKVTNSFAEVIEYCEDSNLDSNDYIEI